MIVYRLISTCSVEEKIYRRQVFKNSISKATLEDNSEKMMKYFDDEELVELLQFDEKETKCKTLDLILQKHPIALPETPTLSVHVPFLQVLDKVAGVTDHQSMFSVEEEQVGVED